MKSTVFKTLATYGGVIHGGLKSGEILAQRPPGVAGRPEGQNLEALVALCG
jgi:hypothetical protein